MHPCNLSCEINPEGRVCIRTPDPGLPRRRAASVLQPQPQLLFLCRIWYWGYISFYDSSGYVQELGPSLEESRAQLEFLQQHTWIDNM